MSIAQPQRVLNAAEVAALDAQHVARMLRGQGRRDRSAQAAVQTLQHQLEWFKRQLFGSKSERFAPMPDPQQLHLGQVLGQDLPVPPSANGGGEQQVPSHTRRKPRSDFADDSASAPFFDEGKVPVQTIEVPNPETQGPRPRAVRGHRREGQPSPGAAPGQLRGAEVRAPGDQAPRHADAALRAGAAGRDRGQPRRCELHRRAAGRQVRVAPAAVPPAPAARRGGLQAQPAVADAAGAARRAAARADLRGAARVDLRQPRQGDGRDADQGRARRSRAR